METADRGRDLASRIEDEYRAMVCSMPLDKITVSELCRRVGVSRKTFYGYYDDKEAVLAQIVRDDISRPAEKLYPLCSTMDKQVSARLLNELVYRNLAEHRTFYLRVVTQNRERIFVHALQRCLEECHCKINEIYCGRPLEEPDERWRYASCFLAAAQAAVIVRWIRGGMETPTAALGEWFTDWSMPAVLAVSTS